MKVSVVVAVYNPGQEIDKLLESLDAQSMPRDEFEVIFADDDSTDGTRERLRDWARERPNVRVLHNTPNSGWPGRPRNLGIDAAKGEFVFFADNDDKFTPKALEWMYDYAHANQSDVVVTKEVGVGADRGVMGPIFRKNIPDAKLGTDPILGVLTPHKLIRTSLLREHGIRFPEGRVRLEDHYVVIASYFAAKRISVLADRLCYYWMRRESSGENAQFSSATPAVYYAGVARALEVVEANTTPGDFRNELYSHWYITKMLARLGGGFLTRSPASRERLVEALREVSTRFGMDERMLPYLGAGTRARAQLLHHGTVDDLCDLAKVNRVTSRVSVDEFTWTDDGRLSLSVRAEFVYEDSKKPVELLTRDGRVYWEVPAMGGRLDPIDVSDCVGKVMVDVLATDRTTHEMRYLVSRSRPVLSTDRIAAITEVVIDPAEIFREKPVGTVIDLRTRLTGFGWTSIARIPVPKFAGLPAERSAPEYGRVQAYGTKGYGKLSLKLVDADGRPRLPKEAVSSSREAGDDVPGWGELAVLLTHAATRKLRRTAGKARRVATTARR